MEKMKTEGGVTEEKLLWWKPWFNFKGRFCIYFKLNTATSSKSLHVNKSIILSKYFNHDFPHTGNDVWSSERNRSQQAETETAALKFKWCQSLKGKGVEPMLTEWKGDTWVPVCPRVCGNVNMRAKAQFPKLLQASHSICSHQGDGRHLSIYELNFIFCFRHSVCGVHRVWGAFHFQWGLPGSGADKESHTHIGGESISNVRAVIGSSVFWTRPKSSCLVSVGWATRSGQGLCGDRCRGDLESQGLVDP